MGASLRELTYEGRDLVVPFAADELRPNFRGTTLAPWPNRIVDGRYRLRGIDYQLPLTEPARGQALHGLVAWLDFAAIEVGESFARLGATIEPQTGYPWRVEVETTYSLDTDGLSQTVKATNVGSEVVPWGTGPHPYLVAGASRLDEWMLTLPAAQVLTVTDDRLSPVRLVDVDAEDPERFDFRDGRPIGSAQIDHAYTGLTRAHDGLATVRLIDPDGKGVLVSWDSACSWVQIHTADLPDGPVNPGHRAGLAVEPMTCAPDAFNADGYGHDTGLVLIAPGGSSEASWTIRAL